MSLAPVEIQVFRVDVGCVESQVSVKFGQLYFGYIQFFSECVDRFLPFLLWYCHSLLYLLSLTARQLLPTGDDDRAIVGVEFHHETFAP